MLELVWRYHYYPWLDLRLAPAWGPLHYHPPALTIHDLRRVFTLDIVILSPGASCFPVGIKLEGEY